MAPAVRTSTQRRPARVRSGTAKPGVEEPATLTLLVPLFLVVAPSLTAYAVYHLSDREFGEIDTTSYR